MTTLWIIAGAAICLAVLWCVLRAASPPIRFADEECYDPDEVFPARVIGTSYYVPWLGVQEFRDEMDDGDELESLDLEERDE